MAILDAAWAFSTAQAITTTADSTNLVDLIHPQDFGIGPVDTELAVQVVTTFAGGTSVNFQFCGAPDNGSGSPGTWTVYAESGAIPVASLTAGAQPLRIPVPAAPAGAAPPRFYKFTYVVVGTMTAGAVTAGVVADRQSAATYAQFSGVTYWGAL